MSELLVRKYLVGADIEWFLRDKDSGEIKSAEGIIKGTKYDPFKFDPLNPFFATSLDNVMAEGNIPPANSPYEFYQNVNKLIEYISSIIPDNLAVLAVPSARLSYDQLQTENAQVFGCDPSLNCWTKEEVRPMPTDDNLRCAGAHIHVGYEDPNPDTNLLLARAMDLYLGAASVMIEPINERRKVGYGGAGNYRNQKHGVEYRALSSHFCSTKPLIQWCYNNTRDAIDFVNNGRSEELSGLEYNIQEAINSENKEIAKWLVDQFNINLI